MRGDKLVEHRTDLGDADDFSARQFNILGGYVDDRGRGHVFHSVAELQDMATEMRLRPQDIYREQEPDPAEDWIGAYRDTIEAANLAASGRKSIRMGAR